MDYDIEMNKKDYQREKEARAKRLEAYAEAIQTITLQKSSKVIEELIEERRRQGLTQQIYGQMTGRRASILKEKYSHTLDLHG